MKFIFLFAITLLAVSCADNSRREDLLPDAIGNYGEVVLLMEDDLWEGSLGAAVMYHLDQNAKGVYLRPEPMFNVIHKRPDELGHFEQLNRLILKVMIDFDSTYKETAVIEKPNYYAKGQLFIIVKDSDPDRLYSYIVNEFAYVVNKMNNFETDNLIRNYKSSPNLAVKSRAEANFGISISIPEDSKIRVDSTDFLWVKRDRSRYVMANESTEGNQTYWIQEGILIWSKPYTDTSQLTVAGVLRDRDSVLKYNVPGKVPGSYMATEYDPYYSPKGRIIKFDGAYGVEIQGLWKHAGDPSAFGGGPFSMYALHNEARQTVVSVCIYIYGPKFDKREYLREAEAMLQTIEFVQ